MANAIRIYNEAEHNLRLNLTPDARGYWLGVRASAISVIAWGK